MLFDVLPAFSEYHPGHRRSGDANFPRKGSLSFAGCGPLTKLADLFISQLGAPMTLAPRQRLRVTDKITSVTSPSSASTFSRHILGVASCGAEKQMRGPNAAGIIASMADHEPLRDRSVRKSPANSVCTIVPSATDTNLTVALPESTSDPHPARTKLRDVCKDRAILVNLRPETGLRGTFPSSHRRASSLTLRFRGQSRSGCQGPLRLASLYHVALAAGVVVGVVMGGE